MIIEFPDDFSMKDLADFASSNGMMVCGSKENPFRLVFKYKEILEKEDHPHPVGLSEVLDDRGWPRNIMSWCLNHDWAKSIHLEGNWLIITDSKGAEFQFKTLTGLLSWAGY